MLAKFVFALFLLIGIVFATPTRCPPHDDESDIIDDFEDSNEGGNNLRKRDIMSTILLKRHFDKVECMLKDVMETQHEHTVHFLNLKAHLMNREG